MTKIYYGLVWIVHIIALPLLCILALQQKYRQSIPLRFLCPKNYSKQHYDIWLHACSFGEVSSLQTLIQSIPKTRSIFLTVITQTGYNQALKLYRDMKHLTIAYLPFESLLPFCTPKCKMLLVFEAELWLMLFVIAKKNNAIIKLVNARISTHSFKRYYALRFFYTHLFSYIDYVYAQSNDDAMRLKKLGAKHVMVLGNIKATIPIAPTKLYLKPKRLIIIAASTHANEEKYILESFKKLRTLWQAPNTSIPLESPYNHTHLYNAAPSDHITKKHDKALFIIVPRHPERFSEVYNLCIKDFKTLRFSDIKQAHDTNEYTYDLPSKSEHHVLKSGLYFDALDCEILLIDTMGELINLYAISDIVILGGAFEKIGGHNPLEVANFHSVLLSGKEIFNQQSLFASIHNYYLVNYHEIVDILSHYPLLNRSQINIAYNTDMITTILESP